MISLPLYCKSIKQINCFKRQTANILSSVPSNHSLKRQRRQVANVPKSFVRTSDEKWPSIAGGPVSKQSPPIVLHVHGRSEGSAENAPIAILSLRSAWPVPEARCQNSAKRLSISSSDLHFLFTLPAAESLSKHSLSSCEIIDILSARQRPSDREKSKENTSK